MGRLAAHPPNISRSLAAARLQDVASEEFIERSKLYRERGLSLDTALAPNFAIEESLKAMKTRGLWRKWMAAGDLSNVAVIGPGLDFTDKASGYDFYPEQTIQPFVLIDSLLRLGLAKGNELWVTAFALSPRALGYLARARMAAPQDFDLIIGANILVYDDVFEQSPALANIEIMLRDSGFLLSKNALLELPVSKMKWVDYLTVVYLDRPDDGDHSVWYQRAPARQ